MLNNYNIMAKRVFNIFNHRFNHIDKHQEIANLKKELFNLTKIGTVVRLGFHIAPLLEESSN